MSKKKRKSSKKKSNGASLPKSQEQEDLSKLIDPRVMEGVMRELLDQAGILEYDDPAMQEALRLIDEAYESEDMLRQLELAAEALEMCPDCAEAHMLAAELAPSAEAACTLYLEAVRAAERTLGPDRFEEYRGNFWSEWQTRPYMRARHGLVQNLWTLGSREEAISHCREMLELNPADDQGVRYLLASYYCDLGRDDELEELLSWYEEDDSAEWQFSHALLSFRRSGDTATSCQRLQEAHAANPHVAAYLLGHRQLPDDEPSFVEGGADSAAVNYAMLFMSGWRATRGAISWMRKTLQVDLPVGGEIPRRRTLKYLVEAVSELPQEEGEVWQVDLRKTRVPTDSGESDNYSLIVTNPDADEILALEGYPDGRPSPNEVFIDLLELMRNPTDQEPRRPECIEVRLKTLANSWARRMGKLDILCDVRKELSHVNFVLQHLQEAMQHQSLSMDEVDDRYGELSELPMDVDAVWQMDERRLSVWITEDGLPDRPWASIVTNRSADLILQQDLEMSPPSQESVWRTLMSAMLGPMTMDPHLPREVQVGNQQFCDWLTPYLEPLNVACVVCEELDMVDFIFTEMERGLEDPDQMPAMVDTPGVTAKHVAGVFEAAAAYYQASPWRDIPGDRPIRVQCDQFTTDTWYAVVMGQSGMTLGLALYEDLDALKAILADEKDSERRNAGLSVMYGEQFAIAIRDLDAAERNNWPVAGPEAYPMVMRVNPGMAVRPPLAWELQLLEACLRAIPVFLRRGDRAPSRMAVPAASGELLLELAYSEHP